MSSPSAVHGRPMSSRTLDKILNHPMDSGPQRPHNVRPPPHPQINPAYAGSSALDSACHLNTAEWPDDPSMAYSSAGPSYQYPAPSYSSTDYPPNRNTVLISPNWASTNVPYEPASSSSSGSDMEMSSGYTASHRDGPPQNARYRQRGSPSPEIDASPYQVGPRASVRLVARENFSPLGNSPTDSTNAYYYQQQLTEQQRKKRNISYIDDPEESPKSKRKLSAKPRADGPNKRSGYTAKKRSEAAQVAAQSGRMPTSVWTVAPKSRGDDGPLQIVPVKYPDGTNLLKEAQTARCMSSRYKNEDFPKCISCTRRWARDTCRFQNIRLFFRDSEGKLGSFAFTEGQEDKPPTMKYPDHWNVPLEKSHIHETKKTIAAALLPTLREELQHINLEEVIYRARESEVRATCDTCLTSIFCCSWMCRTCGREACPECFQQIKCLTIEPAGTSQDKMNELQMRRDKHLHSNPFFLTCLKRNEHGAKDFSPMTRFSKPELVEAIRNMEQLLQDEGISIAEQPVSVPVTVGSVSSDHATTSNSSSSVHMPPHIAPSRSVDSDGALIANGEGAHLYTQPTSPIASGSSSTPPEIPSHEIPRFKDSDLTEEIFRPLWARGEPLLVTEVGAKLKINWSPGYFMKKYGTQNCLIIECQTEDNKRITVGEFFADFGQYEGRDKCWKLKDWPPSSDFKADFPELYEDFSQAVPIPNYVRRDGALNIASHFPTNTIGPDLGPKMYNANANRETFGNKGSTRLHMDMADALNLMTYAAPDADGQEGCAAWDLFRAQDSDNIRQFLRAKFAITALDPIHSQQVYLDDEARRQLWEEYGVKSYRVYQKAGEAVFIPAGCAHQVRNLSDCIKVAIDFVSPENIERCEKLTREFREVNQTTAWKEDVLQLRTMMWFAWLSCCQQESLQAA